MNDKRLAQLIALAELIRERELSSLTALSEERRQCEVRVQESREHRRRTIAAATTDAAHFAGTDDAWLRWNARHMVGLSREAAIAAARTEAQIRAARRAFGRASALAGITRKTKP